VTRTAKPSRPVRRALRWQRHMCTQTRRGGELAIAERIVHRAGDRGGGRFRRHARLLAAPVRRGVWDQGRCRFGKQNSASRNVPAPQIEQSSEPAEIPGEGNQDLASCVRMVRGPMRRPAIDNQDLHRSGSGCTAETRSGSFASVDVARGEMLAVSERVRGSLTGTTCHAAECDEDVHIHAGSRSPKRSPVGSFSTDGRRGWKSGAATQHGGPVTRRSLDGNSYLGRAMASLRRFVPPGVLPKLARPDWPPVIDRQQCKPVPPGEASHSQFRSVETTVAASL